MDVIFFGAKAFLNKRARGVSFLCIPMPLVSRGAVNDHLSFCGWNDDWHHVRRSDELGDFFDAAELWVPVIGCETFALEGIGLHAVVVPGANGVQIGALSQFGQLLGRLVQRENLLHAVEVLANVVLVLKNTKSSFNLILESLIHFF